MNNVADGGGDGRTRRPSSDPGRHGPQPSHGPVKPPEPNLNGSGPTAGSGASGQNLQCHVSDKSSHRVYWRPPFMMAFGLILGTLISLAGHHVFYSSLSGRVVARPSDQDFNVRVGSFFDAGNAAGAGFVGLGRLCAVAMAHEARAVARAACAQRRF